MTRKFLSKKYIALLSVVLLSLSLAVVYAQQEEVMSNFRLEYHGSLTLKEAGLKALGWDKYGSVQVKEIVFRDVIAKTDKERGFLILINATVTTSLGLVNVTSFSYSMSHLNVTSVANLSTDLFEAKGNHVLKINYDSASAQWIWDFVRRMLGS